MKKLLLTVGVVVALLVAFTLISESSNKAAKAPAKPAVAEHGEGAAEEQGHDDAQAQGAPQHPSRPAPDHMASKVNCKTCHDCEYPTKENPCLVPCPKKVISVYHSPEQAPDVLVLKDLSQKYGSVVFTHKVHAQMSEMGHGCSGCHHYNTTGPVLNCKKCHSKERKREEIGTPDLEAAYHRQCMPCHRNWSKSTGCNDSCHQLKTAQGAKSQQERISKISGKTHPRSAEPTRVVYNTASNTGRYVTFYHNEHVAKFNLPCTGCHKDEKCLRCHEVKTADLSGKKGVKTAAKADFGTRHKRCASCHDTRNCNTCHGQTVAQPFNHAVNARWNLGKNHARLSCDRCHGKSYPLKKLDARCASCHTGWKLGSFNHGVTGLSLSKNHQEIECNSCHPGKEFDKKPVCKECHDDKEYPKALPGTRKRGGSTSL